MSSEKYIPFGVKASNLASVANFSSTLEDSYILIIANNCNTPVDNGNSYDNMYNNLDNAALFGVNIMNPALNNNQEAYIGIKNNDLSHKIAKFNRETINFDVNTIINGNLCPTINSNYDIGSVDNQWKNLYLSESVYASTIYADGTGLSNVNISDRTTSELYEGSNLYFTEDRVRETLYQSSLDQIKDGTSNKFINDGKYDGDIVVDGILSVQSIVIRDFENLPDNVFSISNFITEVVAESTSVVKEGTNLYYTNTRTGSLIDSCNVHVSNYISNASNDIVNDLRETSNQIHNYIITNDSNMSNFISDAIENNVNVSNLVADTSNFLRKHIDTTSNNIVQLSILNDSNVSNYIFDVSDYLVRYIDTKQPNITGAASTIVNSILSSRSVVTTTTTGRITSSAVSVTELEHLIGTSNKVQTQIDNIKNSISVINADQIRNGIANKYIVNDTYNSDLHVNGSLYASSLFIEGDSTTINTTTYETENLHIISKDADGPSFIISHESPLYNVIETCNNGDAVFFITSENNVGFGINSPEERLEVSGMVKATGFIGDGNLLRNVHITDSTTSKLPEGSNLYFTPERVGEIIDSSNIGISNFIWQTSNLQRLELETYIGNEITSSSNDIIQYSLLLGIQHSTYVDKKYIDSLTYSSLRVSTLETTLKGIIDSNDSNMSNYVQNTTDHFTIIDSNMSNYINATSNIISESLSALDTLIRNDIQTKLDETCNFVFSMDRNSVLISSADNLLNGTSNKFIVNDTIDSDLNVTGGIDVKFLIIDGVQFDATSYIPEINSIVYNLDFITSGTSNKYIKNNVYDDDLRIKGNLEVDNLTINNKISLINNSVYSSECLEIVNITDSASIKVSQIGSGDIFNIENDYEQIFVMKNNGQFGNVTDPMYDIDINGVINATYIRGDGSQMSNVNIVGNNTSGLTEGSNLFFTEERVYQILYSSNYEDSNIFKPHIDSLYMSVDDIRKALLCINIDNVVQGSMNKYIVNNIYNDSLVINGTLMVRDIQIMDLDNDYSNIYTSNLYKCPQQNSMEMPQYLNISNMVNDIIANMSFANNYETSNMILDTIDPLYSNIYGIYSNLEQVNLRIEGINTDIGSRSADYLQQGTSNKFIINDVYNGSIFINGVLTVRGVNIIDIDDYVPSEDNTLQNFNVQDVYTTNANISNIVRSILSHENYENQINDSYELMAYAIERETSLLSNRLNTQANEISLLKNNIEILTNLVNSLSS